MEILIAMSIFLLVVFAIYSSFETSRATYGAGEQKADIQQSARIAMELMERDLRHAGYGFPAGADCDGDLNPDNPIMVANATSITFCADLVNASTIILDVDVNPGDITLNVEDASGIQAGDTIYLINGGQWEPLTVASVNTGINPHTITTTAGAANAYPWGTKVGRPLPVTYCACVDPDAAGPLPWACAALNFNTLCNDAGDGAGLQPLADNIQTFQFQYGTSSGLYQFTDKDSVTLQREFTRQVAAGALASLNLKLVSTVPGATPPASCVADCFAYDPNGASDPASIPPADLGYVGGLDSSNYGGGTTFTNLNLLSDVRFITIWSAATGTLVQSSNIFSSPTDASDLAKLGTFSLYTAGGE